MDFSLTNEQSQMVDMARNFAKKSVIPHVEKFDGPGAPYPEEWINAAGELGFNSMVFPTELDGIGAGTLAAGLVLEELAAGCAGLATAVLGSVAGSLAVLVSSKPADAKRLLAQDMAQAGGKWRVSLAGLPSAPFEVSSSGGLSGKASGVIGAGHASWYALPVKESETMCYAVPADAPGLVVEEGSQALGLRAAGLGKVSAKDLKVDPSWKLGAIDPDFLLALVAPLQGCIAVGCARGALDAAENYARERYQGGETIVRHDAVAHLILSNRAKINAARTSLWRTLAHNDSLIDNSTGRLLGAPDVVDAVLARVFATDAALQAALDSVQCFGGYGYMRDYPVEKRLRDSRSIGVVFGTAPDLLSHIKHSLEEA